MESETKRIYVTVTEANTEGTVWLNTQAVEIRADLLPAFIAVLEDVLKSFRQ
jgi:hypothetical protein